MNDLTAISLITTYLNRFPQKAIDSFETLAAQEQIEIINSLDLQEKILILKRANPETLSKIIQKITDLSELGQVVEPNDMARIIGRLPIGDQNQILQSLAKPVSLEITQALQYPQDTAGAMMDMRIPIFYPSDTVKCAIERLKKFVTSKNLTTIFLVDLNGLLVGKVHVQDLISSSDNDLLKQISHTTPYVNEMSSAQEVAELVEKHRVTAVPVVDGRNVFIGVIRYKELMVAIQKDALDDIQRMVGVSKDEKALSSPLFAIKKRLPWLTINLATTFLAAFVVGLFEQTIAKITALAVLLPVVAGQSGNTGAQAQAVTMRGLALREIRMRHKWKVLLKEGMVGLANGVVIGAFCGICVLYWSGSISLSLVIGVAMIFAMFLASLSGAIVPMILSSIGQDPATSSSIILTTITDIVGFVTFLGLAALFIKYLH